MLRRAARQHSSFVEVPHAAMFEKQWRGDNYARSAGGVNVFRTWLFLEPDERAPKLDEVPPPALQGGVRCGTPPRMGNVY